MHIQMKEQQLYSHACMYAYPHIRSYIFVCAHTYMYVYT